MKTENRLREIKAMLSLLDDPDPFIQNEIEKAIIKVYSEEPDLLMKAVQEFPKKRLKRKIKSIIRQLQYDHTISKLKEWREKGGTDLLEGWIFLSQLEDPTLNFLEIRHHVQRLINLAWLEMPQTPSDIEKILAINNLLFKKEHFIGNFHDPTNPENFFIDKVLEKKTGNTLSLCSLYYIIAKELGCYLQIVNFNGYYLLRYFSSSLHFYIDPFNEGILYETENVKNILRKIGIKNVNLKSYKPLTHIYIILHFLEGLIQIYKQKRHYQKSRFYKKVIEDIDISLP